MNEDEATQVTRTDYVGFCRSFLGILTFILSEVGSNCAVK